jgi:hypothetical protein
MMLTRRQRRIALTVVIDLGLFFATFGLLWLGEQLMAAGG